MLYLHGLGHFHPEAEIDNAFLESLDIGTTEEWIVSRVGIHSRRTVLPLDYIRHTLNRDTRAADEASLHSNADTGARAARMAIERAGLSASDIGMVIAGGSSPETLIPAEASAIAHELGIDAAAFDMHAACSTFGLQLHFLANLAPAALPDYVLCVVPENSTRVIDFSDRSAAILFGDATAAAVVSTKHAARVRVTDSLFGGAPEGAMDVVIPRGGFFVQNGSKVQKFAIKRMAALLKDYQGRVGTRAADLVYIGHQANLTMLRSVVKRCAIEPHRHWFNIDRFGNQAAAGAPTVLSQRWAELKDEQQLAMIVVGSGLSWSALMLEVGGE